jgi:lipopolysaccharide biosynthesis glycosyltransferase
MANSIHVLPPAGSKEGRSNPLSGHQTASRPTRQAPAPRSRLPFVRTDCPRPINVGCAGNAAYGLPMSVMLTSLVCHAKTNRDIHIYIIESDMDDLLRQKIEASVLQNKKSFHQVTFHWSKLSQFPVNDLPGAGNVSYLTPDAYARLFIPHLLPADAEQVIYLDTDMVVLADVAELSDSADTNCILSAVANVVFPYVSSPCDDGSKTIVFNYAELGIPPSTRYFNSGVLVINVKAWREQQVTSLVLDYLQRHKDEVRLHDQGGLNAILYDQWSRLDQRWNQTNMILYPEWWPKPAYTRKEWLKTKNNPFIVHYSGDDKPWNPGFKRPRLSFFSRYFKRTLFKGDLPMFSIESIVGYRNYFFLWRAKRKIHSLFNQIGRSFPRAKN